MIRILPESRWREAMGITHARNHHDDECLAAVMLSKIYSMGSEGFLVCRTRNNNIVADAMAGGYIVFDIGGEYNPDKHYFDHHQKGFDKRREPRSDQEKGTKYATAGLVWLEYGRRIAQFYADQKFKNLTLSEEQWKSVVERVDRDFIEGLDFHDNGGDEHGMIIGVPAMVEWLNSTALERKEATDSFEQDCKDFYAACEVIDKFLERAVVRAISIEIEKDYIAGLLKRISRGQCYLLLKDYCSFWIEAILELSGGQKDNPLIAERATKISFCIFQQDIQSGEWSVQAIPPSKDQLKEQRVPFPESWRGLRGIDLEQVSGVPFAIFCHQNGFLAKASTELGAMTLAAVAYQVYKRSNSLK